MSILAGREPGWSGPRRAITILAALLALLVMSGQAAAAVPSVSSGIGKSAAGAARFEALVTKSATEGPLRVLVRTASPAARDAVIEAMRGTEAELLLRYELLPVAFFSAGSEEIQQLAANPLVLGIQEDAWHEPAMDSSTAVIGSDRANAAGYDGRGTAVAILDSGSDVDHPYFADRIVAEACFSKSAGTGDGTTLCPSGGFAETGAGSSDIETGPCVDGSSNFCSHGSHVAGTAAGDGSYDATVPRAGVAPGADIISVQVFTRIDNMTTCSPRPTPCLRSSTTDILLGLEYVLSLVPTLDSTVVSANMSIGTRDNITEACDDDARKAAIDQLLAANVATTISAGNQGHPNGVGSPGCISSAVTVGATNDDDSVASFSNRGTLVDLMAPGVDILSAVSDDAFGTMQGTSMAAPHVAGAWAVLRQADPSLTVAQALQLLQDTGVAITYGSATTSRIDLMAALQALNEPPVVSADNSLVQVDEGSEATNTGTVSDPDGDDVTLTASKGVVTNNGDGTWSWSLATNDDLNEKVTITATDSLEETAEVTFDVEVGNVSPTVALSDDIIDTIDEGSFAEVAATFTDPGWADTHDAAIDWGTPYGDASAPTPGVMSEGPPERSGTVTDRFQYGDNGDFPVRVTVTDDDGGSGWAEVLMSVLNVAPTAAIDLTEAADVNGIPTFMAAAGEALDYSGRSTDPGSDDLSLSWAWGDGTSDSTEYLVNAPLYDPPNLTDSGYSPTVQPRDVTDTRQHAYSDACRYTLEFNSMDDDGAGAMSSADVIITGDASRWEGAGYWQHQYQGNGTVDYDTDQLECLLDIVGHMSVVMDEERDASTIAAALDVIQVDHTSDMAELLDRQIITAWLNFGSGAYQLAQAVDTDGDRKKDSTFEAAVAAAETVRVDPAATRVQLEQHKNILERINEAKQ